MYSERIQEYLRIKNILELITSELEKIKGLEERSNLDTNDNRYLKLINGIEKEININKISIEELKNPFLLFIVGNGNYGKSTVINALLKSKIVETTDLPNTWKLDLFILSSNENMEIIYKNKSKKSCKIQRGSQILKSEEEEFKNSKKRISKEMKEYKKKNKYSIDKLKAIKKELEDKNAYKSDIEEVHYYLKDINFLEDFIIVDTPGINQNLLKNTKDIMHYYYKRADGVLWMIDAQNIVAKENSELIKEICEIGKIYGNNKNIIGVVNKMDIIEKYNNDKIYKIKSRVDEIYREYLKDIVYISAKEAIEGITTNNKDSIIKSNINSLYKSIENNFKIVSQDSQIKSKQSNLYIMRERVLNSIEIYKRNLYIDISKYNQCEYELKTKTRKLRDYIEENLYDLKNNSYVEEDFELINLNKDIKLIENICNKEILKIYSSLILTTDTSKKLDLKEFDLTLNFTKSKHLINNYYINTSQNYKPMFAKNNFSNFSYRNSKEDTKDKYIIKDLVIRKINEISNEILNSLDEKIEVINNNINELRENSFKEKHISYVKVGKLITLLNNIEDILNNMG